MSVVVETTASRVSLPLPTHFSHAEQSFSLKKRHVPFSSSSLSNLSFSSPARVSHSLPPLPPSKGGPPLSRVFAQHPSPWTPLSCSLSKSPSTNSVYDPSKQQSYFSQCFTNLGLLGRGSFGEVYKVSKTEAVEVEFCILRTTVHIETLQQGLQFSVFFVRCWVERMVVSTQWSARLIASGETVRGTWVWGKRGTMSVCVLTPTSWSLWRPGRSMVDCTFRPSCVAPACCSMLRTSLPAQVCLNRTITRCITCFAFYPSLVLYCKQLALLTCLLFKSLQSRWACSLGLPVRPPLSAAALALSWVCSSGPQAGQRPHHWLWSTEAGGLRAAASAQTQELRVSGGESERRCSGGGPQVHGPGAPPWGIWTCCGCFQVQMPQRKD